MVNEGFKAGRAQNGEPGFRGGDVYIEEGAMQLSFEDCIGIDWNRGRKVFQIGNGTCKNPQNGVLPGRLGFVLLAVGHHREV